MLVRVCSASAPVVDGLHLGAAPNLAFLQMNPTKRHNTLCLDIISEEKMINTTKTGCSVQRWMDSSAAQKTSPWTGALHHVQPAEMMCRIYSHLFSVAHLSTTLQHTSNRCHFMGEEIFLHLTFPSRGSQLQSYSHNEMPPEEIWGEKKMPQILVLPPRYGEISFFSSQPPFP